MHMLGKIVCIMKMDDTLFMCLYYIRRQQESLRNILADLSGHIISLYTVYSRILIRILLLHFLIITL